MPTTLETPRCAPLDDGELAEMHVAATHAHHTGHTRVMIDPLHLLMLLDEVQVHRRGQRAGSQPMDALIARSSLGAGLRAMQTDPEAELERIDAELTDEVMGTIRAANREEG